MLCCAVLWCYAAVMAELETLGKVYPFAIPPFFALILRAFSVIEGIALTVDPDYSIVQVCGSHQQYTCQSLGLWQPQACRPHVLLLLLWHALFNVPGRCLAAAAQAAQAFN